MKRLSIIAIIIIVLSSYALPVKAIDKHIFFRNYDDPSASDLWTFGLKETPYEPSYHTSFDDGADEIHVLYGDDETSVYRIRGK